MDYIASVSMKRHRSFEAFDTWRQASDEGTKREPNRLIPAVNTCRYRLYGLPISKERYFDAGRESAGVPQTVHDRVDARICIPLMPAMRSLNIAVAAAMVIGEALRQTQTFPDISNANTVT